MQRRRAVAIVGVILAGWAIAPGAAATAGRWIPESVAQATVGVVIETTLGDIELELDAARAPVTVANFLRYVDAGAYNGGRFHRAVRRDNQVRDDVLIEVLQASRNRASETFPPIALERTRDTGLAHLDGTISMARSAGTDTARSDFFICVGDQPSLDHGGARSADGEGFAAFGRVVAGMEVVRAIHQGETDDRERLLEPAAIRRIVRRD